MYYTEYIDFLSAMSVKQDIEEFQAFKQKMRYKEMSKNQGNNQ